MSSKSASFFRVQVFINFLLNLIFSHVTRQTQVEHPLAARYGQLLNNGANETSSNGNASSSSSSTLTGGGGSSLVAVVAAQQQPIVYQNSATRVIQPQLATAVVPAVATATAVNNSAQAFQQQQQQHIYANANQGRALEQSQQPQQQQQQVGGNGSGNGSADHVYSNMTEALMQMQHHANPPAKMSSDNLSGIYGNIGCNRSIMLEEMGDVNCIATGPHIARALPMPIRSGRASECLVPANPYLNEKIPDWLIIYSKANQEHDHKLKVSGCMSK